jgi:hypothetical protein
MKLKNISKGKRIRICAIWKVDDFIRQESLPISKENERVVGGYVRVIEPMMCSIGI